MPADTDDAQPGGAAAAAGYDPSDDADLRRAMDDVRAAVDRARELRELEGRVHNLEKLLQQAVNGLGAARSSFAANLFLARVDEDGAWTEQAPQGSGTNVTLADFADGRSGSTKQVIPAATAAGSNRVQAVIQLRGGNALQFFALPAGAIVGKLTTAGGSDGTPTTAPTYTYDATYVTFAADRTPTAGVSLGSALEPIVARPHGAVDPAEYGLLLPASDGGYVLLVAFEVPETTEDCS